MTDPADVLVEMRHIRKHFCSRGARALAAHLGFDWTHFLKHGITADKLIATGDAMAIELAEVAIKEHEDERRQQ